MESDARRERRTTAKPSIYNDKKLNVASCRGDAGTPQSSPGNGASNLRMDHEYKRAVTTDTTKPAMQAILQPKHDPEIQMQSWMCDRCWGRFNTGPSHASSGGKGEAAECMCAGL